MTSESSQSWYVKASFGMEWGPMSLETLREMAENGDLAQGDVARCGLNDEWQPVATLLDRSRTAEDNPGDTASQVDCVSEPLPDTNEIVVSAPPKPGNRRRGALPNWSSYWGSESEVSERTVVAPRLVLETEPIRLQLASALDGEVRSDGASPTRPTVDDADEVPINRPDSNVEFADLEAWKRERSERLERLMKIVREREIAAAEAARAAEAERLIAQPETISGETSDESLVADAETSSLPAVSTSTRRATEQRETWEKTLDRWKRSLPSMWSALLLLILPLVAWWFWPSSDAAIAETYRTMYFELMELRERPNDKTGMEEFLARSQAQLDTLIPGLTKRASPNQPDVQWLLWMGRDCLRPMLKQPRQADTKPEQTFNKLMREWQRLHTPNFEPVEESSATSQAADSTSRLSNRKPMVPATNARDSATAKDDAESDK